MCDTRSTCTWTSAPQIEPDVTKASAVAKSRTLARAASDAGPAASQLQRPRESMAPQKRKDSKDVSDRTIKDKPSKKPVTYGKRRLLHFDYFDSAAASDENAAKAQAQTPTVRARAANDGDTKRPSGLSSLLQFKSRKSSETRIGVQTATLKDPDLKVETMTADPLQADVDTVCAFTGTHAALAKRYLKVSSGRILISKKSMLDGDKALMEVRLLGQG